MTVRTSYERVTRNARDVHHALRAGATARRRLARRYVYTALRGVVPYVGVDGDHGMVFASTADRTVGKHVYMDGDWAAGDLGRALRLGGIDLTGAVFLDVGANIGTTTLQAARSARRVVAVEPEPLNYRLLRANVAVNLLDEVVTTVNVGCSRTASAGRMTRSAVNWGDHRVSESGDVTVELRRLDDLLVDVAVDPREVGFLWIDVQGHEAAVLAGAGGLLAHRPPALVEYWPEALGESVGEVDSILSDVYGTIVDLHDERPTTMDRARERWSAGATDLLCLP